MCDCNDVFMINFKLFLQNRSIYSKYLFVSKTYVLPLMGTSTGERVILLLRAAWQLHSTRLLLLVCPGGLWVMLWLVEVLCLLLSCFAS